MTYLHRDGHMAIRAVENVLIVAWLGQPNLASAIALEQTTRTIAPKYPAGIAHLNLVAKSPTASTFEDDARKRIIAMLHDRSIPLRASATVYGGGGFVAASIRGVLAGLTMLSRTPVKLRFVGSLEEAVPFVISTLEAARAPAPSATVVTHAVTALMTDAKSDGFSF